LRAAGTTAIWYDVNAARKDGGFDADNLANIRADDQAALSVVAGCGASHVPWGDAATVMIG